MENIPAINQRVKEARELLKLNQRAVSKQLGLNPSYYSGVEKGKRKVTSRVVEGLRNFYNVSTDWLYTGNGEILLTNSTHYSSPNPVSSLSPFETTSPKIAKNSGGDFYLRFSQLLRQYNEYDQLLKDVIEIFNIEDLLMDLRNSKVGNAIYFSRDKRVTDSFTKFKEVGFQAIKELLPYKDVIHGYAEATQLFIRQLSNIKEEINLEFDFENYFHEIEETAQDQTKQ